ncbi:MAG: aspartate ammonia-lyase, partial [Solirubrobacteraceae bacterium]
MSPEPLYGGETRKAVENFPISGEVVPAPVIHWLGAIKGAAAVVNGELGLLKPTLAKRIAKAA